MIYIFCAPSGSGKSTMVKHLLHTYPNQFELSISCTTRPPREGEVNGINYHFLSNQEFADKIENGEMLEATVFRDWCYGTSLDGISLKDINVGVFNLDGIDILMDKVHKAMRETGVKHLAVAGGVSANSGLRAAFEDYGRRYKVEVYIPKFSFTTDNAAMEAINGWIKAEVFNDFHITSNENIEQEIKDYIMFFNEERPAYSLNYLTPKQYKEYYLAV